MEAAFDYRTLNIANWQSRRLVDYYRALLRLNRRAANRRGWMSCLGA